MVDRGRAGQLGTRTNAQVEYQIEGNGQTIKPVADTDGRTISRIVGEDSNGNVQTISVDSEGRIDMAMNPDVNIGDVQVLDSSDSIIDPATEETVSSIDSKVATESSLSSLVSSLVSQGTDEIRSKLFGERVGTGELIPVKVGPDGGLKIREFENEQDFTAGQYTTSSADTTETIVGSSITVPDGKEIVVKALNGNAGPVYIGPSTMSTNSEGYELTSGTGIGLAVTDLNKIHIRSPNSGDGVTWTVEQ